MQLGHGTARGSATMETLTLIFFIISLSFFGLSFWYFGVDLGHGGPSQPITHPWGHYNERKSKNKGGRGQGMGMK